MSNGYARSAADLNGTAYVLADGYTPGSTRSKPYETAVYH